MSGAPKNNLYSILNSQNKVNYPTFGCFKFFIWPQQPLLYALWLF